MKSFRKEEVIGKTVIETSGRVMGKVNDVIFDLNGTITFVVGEPNDKGLQIPISRVMGISDHVVVKGEPSSEASVSVSGTSCKFCGESIKTGERWCPRCGKSQV